MMELKRSLVPHLDRPVDDQLKFLAASWRRSELSGVDRARISEPATVGFDPQSRLLRAGEPVLQRAIATLGNSDVAIVIADGRAAVVAAASNDKELVTSLMPLGCEPGMVRSEENVGTNGIGTVVETRKPCVIIGTEHYHERLKTLACAGVPIRDPISNRLEGVLVLTVRADRANQLLLPYAESLAGAVESKIRSLSTRAEQAVFDEFLRQSRSPAQAVIAFNDGSVMATSQAALLLSTEDQARIWDLCSRQAGFAGAVGQLELDRGMICRVYSTPIILDERLVGVVVSLRPVELGVAPESIEPRREDVGNDPRWSRMWSRVRSQVALAVEHSNQVIAVRGETGSGKRRLLCDALSIGVDDPLSSHSVPLSGQGQNSWMSEMIPVLMRGRSLVIGPVDRLTSENTAQLSAALSSSRATVALLGSDRWGEDSHLSSLLSEADVVVQVPALREHIADIPQLVTRIIGEISRGPTQPRFSLDASRALMRYDWPGNISELRRVVATALVNSLNSDVTENDLPSDFGWAGARVETPVLHVSERNAIVSALRQFNGNKSKAARSLGIGRSTLYRKIREHGIEPVPVIG